MNPRILAAVALLLAAVPTIRWYALRLQDGGGELAGLVALAAAGWFIFRDRKSLSPTSHGVWIGAGFLVLQAAAYSFLPAIIRALLMLAAVALVSGIWRKPGILCLLILALPWTASLDFFLGYPLRLLTSINTIFFLKFLGMEVTRTGVQLLHEGTVVGVDPACSGMNILWSTGLLTAMLAAIFSLGWKKMVSLGLVALALALAGNSLRATILFFPEAGLMKMPHLLHPGIGLAIAGGCFLFLMKLARKLSGGALTLVRVSSITIRPSMALTIAAPLVILASIFPTEGTAQRISHSTVLHAYQGSPLTRIPLSFLEENFYQNFPGSIAIYESAEFKLIVRQVNRATRKLHPASHCLRAEGFRIGEKKVTNDKNGGNWLIYSIARDSEQFQVRERIACPSSEEAWAEITAWYWHAFFNPSTGPWEAVTVISPL